MTSDPSSIGIMDGAFFVSKSELLDWLRTDFQIHIAKVEECGSGVVYLYIMERMFPGKVPMRKVKMNAKQEWECLHNLKILQSLFTEQGVKKHIDINRLAKCVYSENLEFLQWIKRFYDRQCGRGHPLGARSGSGILTDTTTMSTGGTSQTSPAAAAARIMRFDAAANRPPRPRGPQGAAGGQCVLATRASPAYPRKGVQPVKEEIEKLRCLIEQRDQEIAFLRQELEDTEAESRFYFGKLRALEMLATDPERSVFTVAEVETILFAEETVDEEQLATAVIEQSETASMLSSAETQQLSVMPGADIGGLPPLGRKDALASAAEPVQP